MSSAERADHPPDPQIREAFRNRREDVSEKTREELSLLPPLQTERQIAEKSQLPFFFTVLVVT